MHILSSLDIARVLRGPYTDGLWENWYRGGRWELWARSQHPQIPVKARSWRRVKKDFLHRFHLPRCDILVWVLVTKLAPHYYRKMDRLLVDTGRYRELGSWRKDFKKRWRETRGRVHAHLSRRVGFSSANTSSISFGVSPPYFSKRPVELDQLPSGNIPNSSHTSPTTQPGPTSLPEMQIKTRVVMKLTTAVMMMMHLM